MAAKQLIAAIMAAGGVVTLLYTAAIRWYTVENGVLVKLPAVEKRVVEHDDTFEKVSDAIDRLTDAALVDKAKRKAKRVECLKAKEAANGALDDYPCPEVEE